jgi:hypothetical protein
MNIFYPNTDSCHFLSTHLPNSLFSIFLDFQRVSARPIVYLSRPADPANSHLALKTRPSVNDNPTISPDSIQT